MGCLYLSGREMTKPYTSGTYMADYTLEELKKLSPEPTEEEKKDPYFKYYSESLAPREPIHEKILQEGPMPSSKGFMPKDAAGILLGHNEAYPENGYCVLDNGVGFSRILVHQQGITDAMIVKYREHFCHTENRLLFYKIWHPHNHLIHFEDGIVENWGWGFCRQDMNYEAMTFEELGIKMEDVPKMDPSCLSFLAIGGTCVQLDRPERKPWPMVMLQYIREVPDGRELQIVYWNGLEVDKAGKLRLQVNPDRAGTEHEMRCMFAHGAGEYCNELRLMKQFWIDEII